MPTRFLVMRHGQSTANVAGEIVSDPARGVLGFGLSPAGRDQVRARLETEPRLRAVTRVVTSDFRRAAETAALVAAALGLPAPRPDPRLRERFFGAFEGRDAANYDEVWRRDATHPEDPGDDIEPVAAVRDRALSLVTELEAAHPDATVLLVCHGDVSQILLTAGAGRPAHRHRELDHLETAGVRELGPNR